MDASLSNLGEEMTDYTNMTPEQEAKLVPDWVENTRGDWFDVSERGVCKRLLWLVDTIGSGRRLCMTTEGVTMSLSAQGAEVVAKALQFFAATGRLPRRIETKEAQDA